MTLSRSLVLTTACALFPGSPSFATTSPAPLPAGYQTIYIGAQRLSTKVVLRQSRSAYCQDAEVTTGTSGAFFARPIGPCIGSTSWILLSSSQGSFIVSTAEDSALAVQVNPVQVLP